MHSHTADDNWLTKFFHKLQQGMQSSEALMVPSCMIAVITFPLYYFVWRYVFVEQYHNLYLRIAGSIVCFPVIFKDYWPASLKQWLPLYWYALIVLCLPFFFTFILLKNNFSYNSSMTYMAGLVFLSLLVNWRGYIITMLLGCSLAYLIFVLTPPNPALNFQYSQLFIYAFLLVVIAALMYQKKRAEQQRISAMLMATNCIAHELRTPLLSLRGNAKGISDTLPELLQGHQMAVKHNLLQTNLSEDRLRLLNSSLSRLDSEINHANIVIDSILLNFRDGNLKTVRTELCSMQECVNIAIDKMKYHPLYRANVISISGKDFKLEAQKQLFVHVIINILKNAFYFTHNLSKAKIRVELSKTNTENMISICNNGEPIPSHLINRLFDRYFSTTQSGAGVGLTFCKRIVEMMGGKIICRINKDNWVCFEITV